MKPRMGCGSQDEERQQEPRKMDVARLRELKNGAWLEKLRKAIHTQAPQTQDAGTPVALGASVMGGGDITAQASAAASAADRSESLCVLQKPVHITTEDDTRNRVDGQGSWRSLEMAWELWKEYS